MKGVTKREMTRMRTGMAASAERLLAELAGRKPHDKSRRRLAVSGRNADIAALLGRRDRYLRRLRCWPSPICLASCERAAA